MADYDWITSRIAIGGAIDGLVDVRKMENDGITQILNVRTNQDEVPWVLKVGLGYASCPTKDKDEESKPASWFKSCADVIRSALHAEGAKILVHCQGGQNRSPGAVYFFLRSIGLDKDLVTKLITDARPETRGKDAMVWNDDAESALKELGYK